MSQLLVLLPQRPRAGDAPGAMPDAWAHGLCPGAGAAPLAWLSSPASQLPAARQVVAVLPIADLAWHRLALPRAPASRLRQALLGLLEDDLLGEDGSVHVALPARRTAGEPTWMAVTDHAWLRGRLAELAAAGCHVERVVPLLEPGASPRGHFWRSSAGAGPMQLSWVDDQGVRTVPAEGSLARGLVTAAEAAASPPRWTSTPEVAAEAERWLGEPVEVLAEAELAHQAAASDWNLLQFDLEPRRRGWRALAGLWREFLSPAWRPLRWGVAGLLGVHLLGLNVWAYQQQRQLDERRTAMVALLRDTYPQLRAVLNAPRQMQQETDRLRARAGEPGPSDLEPLLAALTSAWPDAGTAPSALRYEAGRLTLVWSRPNAAQVQALANVLLQRGWQVEPAADRIIIQRGDTNR